MAAFTQRSQAYFSGADVDARDLLELVTRTTPPDTYPHADEIASEVVVYDTASIASVIVSAAGRREVMAEIAHVLSDGPGVAAFRGAVDRDLVDRATAVFVRIIAEETEASPASGDHFGADGRNERLWNALEKLGVAEPEVFVDYYASDAIALAATAWLGPAYQITSQLNVVKPGGTAQTPHRDYHLGFLADDEVERFPAHSHLISAMLTLQGAVAHCDMPVESGPTKLLPHSQKYPPGYLACRRSDVIDLFEQHSVQLPLATGDALFFNPAVMHAAGANLTADVRRMANLLQIGSAMGRCTEAVDRTRLVRAVYPALLERRAAGWDDAALDRCVAACAEGYAFPTNLDRDPPIGGLAPLSQADFVRQALRDAWSSERLDDALTALEHRRRTT
jgi:ectoine hydroxylase-related dioxygenase (phytanoyl-CoA dioxygenase family)